MLIGVFGTFGSGKTLFLTIMGLNCANLSKYKVFSNFLIRHPKVTFIEPQDFMEINPKDKKAIILLDEAYAWLDSRLSTSRINRMLSHVIYQSRKRNMDIFYDAQQSGSVDLRLRNESAKIIMAEKTFNEMRKLVFRYRMFWQKSWHSSWSQFTFDIPEFKARKVYNKFDTRQIVMPVEKILTETLT